MNEVEIYYFSGTGNSLHAAKELQKRLPEAKLVPMVSLLGQETIKANAETVGFVFPLHLMTAPIPVREFFRKIDLGSAEYVFAVATRVGTPAMRIEKILKKKGRGLDALFFLNMADNDPKGKAFRVTTEEELAKLEAGAQEKLDSVREAIMDREKVGQEADSPPQPVNVFLKFLARLGLIVADHFPMEEAFYTNDKCSGCGTCEDVCLSGKIKMVDGEPVWRKDVGCYMCFACVDFCPEESVQIKSTRAKKSYTGEKGRYHHPEATPEDIAAQKRP